MPGIFELANLAAVLFAGRRPVWGNAATFSRPSSNGDGVDVADAVVAAYKVQIRETPHARTARLTISNVDLSATYTVTIGEAPLTTTPAAYNAGGAGAADLEDVINGIADAINASAANVVASAVTDDDSAPTASDPATTVKIVGATALGASDFAVQFTTTSGSATVAGTADAASATASLYGTTGGELASDSVDLTLTSWAEIEGLGTVQNRNRLAWIEVGRYGRLAVYLANVAKVTASITDGSNITVNARAYVGPCLAE